MAYPIGTVLTVINETGAGTVTLGITSDTLRFLGSSATGNRTLAASGYAMAIKEHWRGDHETPPIDSPLLDQT